MTRNEITRRYPNASESFIRANLSTDVAVPDAQQCECAETLARSDGGEAQGPGLRHCRFTLVRKQLLDVDAKYASVKDLLDCLTIARVIQGDKEGEITLEVNQRKVVKKEPEKTIIEVYEITKQNL